MRHIIWILFIAISSMLHAQELVIYDVPGGLKYSAHNDDFTVQVRQAGGDWQDLFEYNVQVDLDNVQNASMVSFDFSGKVEIQVRKNNGTVNSVQIRPLSLGIVPAVNGQVISFSLSESNKLSLEVNGDKLHNLHLFANPILKDKPNPDDPNVIYFGPGIHQPKDLPGDVFHIPSGKTVYIDGGAVIKAKLLVDHAHDVKIIGHGIIWQPERGVEIRHSKNVTVDGPIFVNPSHYTIYGGQTIGLTVRNIKSFSCKGWSDGIDLMSCSDVVIDDVFMRNSDDCIAIYGHRWDFYGSARNYEIKNSTLWADIAHPTNIGLHGYAEAGGDTIENITFSNIDILEHDEDDRNYQGCMAITCSDNNLVRNITYENIRIEDLQEGQLFNFRVVYNEKYSGAPGRGIENVLLKNIKYNGNFANKSEIKGFEDERAVKKILIDGLTINGNSVKKIADANIQVGGFINELKVK
ncbi:glycosyl hydrolase family 28 protein [Gaoshiqia sediminis]|uniref:Glycosyl hydrolase family 28 protein n=1 Tax=Gaoshiqia sediminis TaxID=2986998 RepID=A0AA41Y784_9BACT|nr:glycosyl hydrolase family 28 protein [Gaoshiqia sediminis]MCW0482392.1 glycosyl hydrolase family 28 protein [Gaoshiqia sediminis]